MAITLYYDGACPLCSKEILLLKRLSKGTVTFVDIHQLKGEGLPSKDTLLKRLHLKKDDGEWLLGLDANVYLWSQTPYGVLFKILRVWPLRPMADFVYNRWAEQRYKKRYECKECQI